MDRSLLPSTLGAVLLCSTALGGPALAACSESNQVVTCTGALSDLWRENNASKLIVNDLSANPIGGAAIMWSVSDTTGNGNPGGSAPDQTLDFTGGTFHLTAPTPPLRGGILVWTTAGAGSSGDHDTTMTGDAHSHPGGAGGEGGVATATFRSGVINFKNPAAPGALIWALSSGGDAGPSDEAKAEISGTANGGIGGGGGDAGGAAISMLGGTLTVSSALLPYDGLYALGAGGAGGGGAEAYSGGGDTHAGAGGPGGWGNGAGISMTGGSVSVDAPGGAAIHAVSTGGQGGDGGHAHTVTGGASHGGDGGEGWASGEAAVTLGAVGLTAQSGARAVEALAQGGDGGDGGSGFSGLGGNSHGGDGGDGGDGAGVSLVLGPATIKVQKSAGAVFLRSLGGDGGDGGGSSAGVANESDGGDGGAGGNSRAVSVTAGSGPASIRTKSATDVQHALVAESIAGRGGDGGDATASISEDSRGGDGGAGGTAGSVTADVWANISTAGPKSQGIFLRSYGGAGGDGGTADTFGGHGDGGAGAGSGPAGAVTLTFRGGISTAGGEANAILAQSVGGFSGDGGDGSGFIAYGGGSQSAGDGGAVGVTLAGGATVATGGASAYGVQAHSVGGGGGRGGSGDGLVSLGGDGSAGGSGGNATVVVSPGAAVATSGPGAIAVHAQSIGGGGGDGGGSLGIVSLGGFSGTGGSGGAVAITNAGTIATTGRSAPGLFAQSVGGGGGSARSTEGLATIGGTGGDGGAGGPVTVQNAGTVSTRGSDADAIFLQSVGGGGGHGGSDYDLTIGASIAIGGAGGAGQFANTVTYADTGAAGRTISTRGDRSRGVFLQSLGGGGGDGGSVVGMAPPGSSPVTMATTMGGSGGSGGDAFSALYKSGVADITTGGKHAPAIAVQSIGGGGGNAGDTYSFTTSAAIALNYTVGGSGAGGGNARFGSVVESTGALSTAGDHSPGVLIQSIGGGGGNAGAAVGGAAVGGISVSPTIGGQGGGGGSGNNVNVTGGGGIVTAGDLAPGIHAQSIGGGGGHGGTTVSGSGISVASANAAVGGEGGSGGTGSGVGVDWDDGITTGGHNSPGVLAQSIGGGGGSAGTTVAGSLSSSFAANVAVGGKGGSGGDGGNAAATTSGSIRTTGHVSAGVQVQSVGGGGGHSGTTIAGDANASIGINPSIGGSGGDGGSAGSASATAASVTTSGHSSAAVVAMSVGGGGGSSGFTGALTGNGGISANVSVGGSGGSAGDGGAVSATVSGALATSGHISPGIRAMSIGGGGGDSGTTVSGSGNSSFAADIGVGGSGGTSGSGGAVGVTTAPGASIATLGNLSSGIIAKSIARGGGSAGHVISASGLSGGTEAINVGGDGGDGGNAGYVSVLNQGSISTAGSFAGGIEASSIAGSGGSAKGDISASALSMLDVSFTLGGGGGNGGNAGTVDVDNGGAISTGGPFAYGILAQSLGGSGGNGGLAAEASTTDGEFSGELGVTIGGTGGEGGSGGAVTVTSDRQISTDDFGSAGIVAQSTGGSGGAGGNVMTGNLNASSDGGAEVNVAIGGNGGTGATASTVSVTNYGGIATRGYFAEGIFAQSVGGNGGRGGSAYTMVTTIEEGTNFNLGATVGGSGGSGQDADRVTVLNTGPISTAKGGASAIFGQSVGGGGGKGGNAANLNINPLPAGTAGDNSSSLNVTVDVGVGGAGGSAGDGAAVEVTNSGSLATEGMDAAGIYAQSIGGGGGDGGTTSSASFSFNGLCKPLTGGIGYGCTAEKDPNDKSTTVSVSVTAEIGGAGGAAGDGGTVTASSDGAISTAGDHSHGIFAHSVGGGGGNGGKGDLGIAAWTTNKTANWIARLPGTFTFIPSPNNVSTAVGGSEGASGDGGDVSVGGTGTIATEGRSSFGVFAQSVGGGGGNAGAGTSGLWSQLTVGGRGSGGGVGGAVTVTQSGVITTSGEGGIGIFAQSVGGGGGTAGDVEKGWTAPWADLNIGSGTGVQLNAGGGGDGGAISVTSAAITTTGVRAHGIVAQSVGGSGGVAAISGTAQGPTVQANFAGSTGDKGNGGAVSVTANGAITVAGDNAHGIFAQSAAGRKGNPDDTAGDVTIEVNADVSATGSGGRAILAQSDGGTTASSGTIAIAVAQGATVATGADAAETIGLLDGNANTITNAGTIRSQGGGTDAFVIRTDGASALAVTNNGVIEGSVLSRSASSLPGSNASISITNAAGASFGFGPTANLGDAGSFANAGTASAGLAGAIGQSNFVGSFAQSSGGTLLVDFDVAGPMDRIDITGSGSLAGTVDPAPQGTLPKSGTQGRGTILTATEGFTGAGLTVADTATVNYSLAAGPGSVALSYEIDYAPWAGSALSRAKVTGADRGRITGNHTRFGRHVDDLIDLRQSGLRAGSDRHAFVDDFVFFLLETPEVGGLLDIYDGYAASEVFAPANGMLFASQTFADALMSCPDLGAEDTYVFRREGNCVWASLTGSTSRLSGPGGYDENVFALSGGAQAEVAPDWFAGFALAYERADFSGSGIDGDGDRYHLGVVAKHEMGATILSASLSGGVGSFDMSRQVITPGGVVTARGNPDGNWIAAHARLAHSFDINERSYLKPWFDLGIQHVRQDGFTERGAGDYGLRVGAVENTLVSLAPTTEFGTGFDLSGMTAEVTLSAGALAFLGDTDRSTQVRLVGVGSDGPGFALRDGLDDIYATLGASLKARIGERTTLNADLGALLGGDYESFSGGVRLSIAF